MQAQQPQQRIPVPAVAPMHQYQALGNPGEYRYHTLLRMNPRNHWEWALLAAVLTGGFFFAFSTVFTIVSFVVKPDMLAQFIGVNGDMNIDIPSTPGWLAWTFASVAVTVPSVFLAYLILGYRPSGQVFSVTGKLRIRLLLLALVISIVLFVAAAALMPFIFGQAGSSGGDPSSLSSVNWLLIAVTVVLIIPVQCAAEELLFRGMIMQVVGSWLRLPIWAILVQAVLFTSGHLYGGWAFAEVAVMGLALGYLAWRTGGLETGIAYHIANNEIAAVTAFISGSSLDMETSGTWESLLISVLMLAVYVALVELIMRLRHIHNTATLIAGDWEQNIGGIRYAPSRYGQPRMLPERIGPGEYRTRPAPWLAQQLQPPPGFQYPPRQPTPPGPVVTP